MAAMLHCGLPRHNNAPPGIIDTVGDVMVGVGYAATCAASAARQTHSLVRCRHWDVARMTEVAQIILVLLCLGILA